MAASGGCSSLPSGPDPEGTLGPEGWSGPRWPPTPRSLDGPSPGLPFSSCSTATDSVGGGGSSTRLSSASTRPGRLGGQMPMWSPGWYCSPSWPAVSRIPHLSLPFPPGNHKFVFYVSLFLFCNKLIHIILFRLHT